MIVYPNAFALSEQALDRPRIGWRTLTRDVPSAVVTASGETASGPRDAPLREDTFEAWETEEAGWWEIDFGSLQDVDYVGLVGNLGSAGAEALVETSVDGVTYTTFSSDVAPADDSAIMMLDTQRSIQKARLTVSAACRVAVVYIGRVLKMQKNVAGGYVPITMARETVLFSALSRGGQFLGQTARRNGLMGSAAFKNLTAAWVRSEFDPFVKEARSRPYFFAWNPLGFPLEVGYCWSEKDIQPKYSGLLDLMDVSWSMRGVGG